MPNATTASVTTDARLASSSNQTRRWTRCAIAERGVDAASMTGGDSTTRSAKERSLLDPEVLNARPTLTDDAGRPRTTSSRSGALTSARAPRRAKNASSSGMKAATRPTVRPCATIATLRTTASFGTCPATRRPRRYTARFRLRATSLRNAGRSLRATARWTTGEAATVPARASAAPT
jgi:hypothetical protein